jgi:hypothetical protein
MIGFRASPDLRKALERWATQQPDSPSLSDSIRRLVELGLHSEKMHGVFTAFAEEAAGKAIDGLEKGSGQPDAERLTKMPRELKPR